MKKEENYKTLCHNSQKNIFQVGRSIQLSKAVEKLGKMKAEK